MSIEQQNRSWTYVDVTREITRCKTCFLLVFEGEIFVFCLFKWDAEEILEDVHLKYSKNDPNIKTHDQLKKKLYREIIQLFDEGDVGEDHV